MWLPLESNPEVLSAFAGRLGADLRGAAFSDVWGLDADALAFVPRPVNALLLLFPVSAVPVSAVSVPVAANASGGPLFIKQTIPNACGTIALLHALLNNQGVFSFAPASPIARLRDAFVGRSPAERAAVLETDQQLAQLHADSSVQGQTAAPSDPQDDVDLHFVAFVDVAGTVWELDGRKDAPVCHGPSGGENDDGTEFLRVAVKAINDHFIAHDPS
ncbi:Ubiquitin carboxyl-terminal hydrolase isozyme L3 [Entophlyctis sp. JEL0112]|nr:Ubiquitin carboxyl-terminal hydrolase isozyme L3 [Entophlyctis sp. JEL0112]